MKTLILLLFVSPCLFAKSYYAKKELPGELNLILQSIAKMKLKEVEKKLLGEIIWKIDGNFTEMDKDEIFFLVKSSVYKTILQFKKKDERIPNIKPKEMEKLVEKKLASGPYSNFTRWLLRAIVSDYNNIFKSKGYKLTQGDKKKLRLIMPWYRFFIETSVEEFELDLKDLHFFTLGKILVVSQGLLQYSRFNYKEIKKKELNFFEYREPAVLSKVNSIDEILGSFPDNPQDTNNLPTPWRPKDGQKNDDYLKDPNYIPPDKLPEPINEKLWAKQGGIDPNYIPPDKLPIPIDENTWNE